MVNINLVLNRYTGIITIAKDLKENFIGRAFIRPYAYEHVYELKIENGKLIEQKDTSGTYDMFS